MNNKQLSEVRINNWHKQDVSNSLTKGERIPEQQDEILKNWEAEER